MTDIDSPDQLALSPTMMPTPRRSLSKASDGEVAPQEGLRRSSRRTKNISAAKRASPTPPAIEVPPKRSKTAAALRKAPSKPAAKAKAKRRRVKEDIFNEPDQLFSSPKSLLYRPEIDIVAILYHPDAIEALSKSEVGWHFGNVSKSDLRHFVELFKAEGAAGQYDEQWLMDATIAGRERAEGKFDEMMQKKFEEEWGCPSGEEYSDTEDEDGFNSKALENGEKQVNGKSQARDQVAAQNGNDESVPKKEHVQKPNGDAKETRSGIEAQVKDEEFVNGEILEDSPRIEEEKQEEDGQKTSTNDDSNEAKEIESNTEVESQQLKR